MSTADQFFATCPPGLEAVLYAELSGLGVRGALVPGGVLWQGDTHSLYTVNLHARIASRVLVRAATFRARTFFELERHARKVPWARFLGDMRSVSLRVTCHKSKLYHEGAVAERLGEAINAATGASAEAAGADTEEDDVEGSQLFVVRFLRDVCTIRADASGALLHRRGYRQALAKAPLRETIAAAMLHAANWSVSMPLLDPLCGSGTIPIEAALLARRVPPGLAHPGRVPRPFAFQQWPEFNVAVWDEIVAQAQADMLPAAPRGIAGSDRSRGAIRAASANAERAGVANDIDFSVRAAEELTAPEPAGLLISNLPYGIRAGDRRSAAETRAAVLNLAASTFAPWTMALLEPSATPEAPGFVTRFQTNNGGIPVRLVVRGEGT